MKKTMGAVIMAAILSIGLIAGCSSSASQQSASRASSGSQDAPSIVCATFPAYDWVMQVLGDKVEGYEVTYLMGSGVDLHSYQPSVEDMATITDADLFVFVGGESDGWAQDAVKAANGDRLRTVNMLEAVGDNVVVEELVEGMQAEEEEEGEEGAEEEEDPEYDEHVWLSLRNAQVLVDAIAAALSEINPDDASAFAANADAYKKQLAELDERYAEAVSAGSADTVVFADRFPFRYLADDYGIEYYAAFVGCSAETEASFETVAFLAKKVDELGIGSIFVIEGSDKRIAETVIQNTKSADQQILVMDSLQSVTDADVSGGKTYLSAMESNLEQLSAALA